jgi:hypothetical protein
VLKRETRLVENPTTIPSCSCKGTPCISFTRLVPYQRRVDHFERRVVADSASKSTTSTTPAQTTTPGFVTAEGAFPNHPIARIMEKTSPISSNTIISSCPCRIVSECRTVNF